MVSKAAGTFTPRPAYDKKERKAATKASIRERKRAREAAAADKPAIAAAPPPRSAPAIAPAPAPAPLGGLGGHGHGGGGLPLLPAAPRPYGGFGHGLVDGPALPHRILFVQNLPAAVERPVLVALFSQLPGFREVRTVESRPGLAFVEYADEGAAAAALAALQGFGVGEEHQPIALSFAKR